MKKITFLLQCLLPIWNQEFTVLSALLNFFPIWLFKPLTFETSVKLENFYFNQHISKTILSNFLSCSFHQVNCDQIYYDNRLFISLYRKGQDYCDWYISNEIHTMNGGNARINSKLNLIFSQLNDWHWYCVSVQWNWIDPIKH